MTTTKDRQARLNLFWDMRTRAFGLGEKMGHTFKDVFHVNDHTTGYAECLRCAMRVEFSTVTQASGGPATLTRCTYAQPDRDLGQSLMADAEEFCHSHGHRMGKWLLLPKVIQSTCTHCGMTAQVRAGAFSPRERICGAAIINDCDKQPPTSV